MEEESKKIESSSSSSSSSKSATMQRKKRALGMPKLTFERKTHGKDTIEYTLSVDLNGLSPISKILVEYSWLDLYMIILAIMTIPMTLSISATITCLIPGLVFTSFRSHFGTIRSESLIAIEEVGVQLKTTYFNGRVDSKFLEKAKIRSVVMNEGITLCRVVFYVAFLMRNESKMTLAFENLRPSLRILTKVFRGIRLVMFGESGERSVSSSIMKTPSSPTSSSSSSSSRRKKRLKLRKLGEGSVRRRIFEEKEEVADDHVEFCGIYS